MKPLERPSSLDDTMILRGHARWVLGASGALLSLGAPLGLRAVWAVLEAAPIDASWSSVTLAYVGVATMIAFTLFGYCTGALVDALQAARHALALEATRDPLTGLFNRRALAARMTSEMQRRARTREPLSLIMLDIDHFKRVNDTHGHPVGDAVLRSVAEHIQRACREVDFAARYGGEEFVVLAPALALDAAAAVADRIRLAVERAVTSSTGAEVRVTISAGVAVSEGENAGADALIQAADSMLLLAKQSGRNQVCVVGAGTK